MLETFDPIQCAHCKSFKNKFFCHRLRSEKIWTLQEIIFTEEIGSCAHGAVYCYLKAKFCSKWKMKNWFWQRSDLFWFFDQFTDCQFCTAFLSHCIAVHCTVYNTARKGSALLIFKQRKKTVIMTCSGIGNKSVNRYFSF